MFSDPFRRRFGDGLSRDDADRLLAAILVNHDTVPDLVSLTATLAVDSRSAAFVTFDTAAAVAADFGLAFDADGWAVAS